MSQIFAVSLILTGTLSISVAATQIATCKTISDSGSYELNRNLTATADCLILAADNIALDLGGYTITGSGSGSAIQTDGVARRGITIRNGTLRNFNSGVNLAYTGSAVRVEKLTVHGPSTGAGTGVGIGVNDGSIVKENLVSGVAIGFMIGSRSLILNNVATNNIVGFSLNIACSAIGNMAGANTQDGFHVRPGSMIVNNTAQANGRYGFYREGGNYIGNTSTMNVFGDFAGAANNSADNYPMT